MRGRLCAPVTRYSLMKKRRSGAASAAKARRAATAASTLALRRKRATARGDGPQNEVKSDGTKRNGGSDFHSEQTISHDRRGNEIDATQTKNRTQKTPRS